MLQRSCITAIDKVTSWKKVLGDHLHGVNCNVTSFKKAITMVQNRSLMNFCGIFTIFSATLFTENLHRTKHRVKFSIHLNFRTEIKKNNLDETSVWALISCCEWEQREGRSCPSKRAASAACVQGFDWVFYCWWDHIIRIHWYYCHYSPNHPSHWSVLVLHAKHRIDRRTDNNNNSNNSNNNINNAQVLVAQMDC